MDELVDDDRQEVGTMTQVRELHRAPGTTMMSWVPVTDAQGRTRMEMRWSVGVQERPGRTSRSARTAAA